MPADAVPELEGSRLAAVVDLQSLIFWSSFSLTGAC